MEPAAGGSLIVIVLLSIATAALFAWIAVELGRFAIGDFRVPRPAIGLLRGPANGVTPPSERQESSPPVSEQPAAPTDEDVERRVRDRLYGERNGALRRAPTSAE
jgi:hypothetical protein